MMVVIGGILTQVVARQFARCPRLVVRMAQQVVAGNALVERRKKSLASHYLPHIVFVQQLHMTIREGLSTPQLPVAPAHQATPGNFPRKKSRPFKNPHRPHFLLDIMILCVIQCMSYTMSCTVDIPMNPDVLENLRLELRRGCLIVAVLADLRREQYGYTLRKSLAEHGIAIDEGTLYPLLRRLETQGLLASEWREQDKRNKRFYRLSPEGGVILAHLLADWKTMYLSLEAILKDTVISHSDPNAPPAVAGEAPASI